MYRDLNLKYSDIQSVRVAQLENSPGYKKAEFKNNVLTLLTTTGKQYCFSSFENTNELRSIISVKISGNPQENYYNITNTDKVEPSSSPLTNFLNNKKQETIAPVQPIVLDEEKIKCPVCNEPQRNNRYVCFKCEQPFINDQPNTP